MEKLTRLTEKIEIAPARPEDLGFILPAAAKESLDTRNADYADFLVAKAEGKIIGFGRLKRHGTFTEMGTFEILPAYRGWGIGDKLMNALIEKAGGEVYLLTTIPEYACRFNFQKLETVPPFAQPYFDDCVKAKYPARVHLLVRKAVVDSCASNNRDTTKCKTQ
jgi:N-acetylglutamate synthase-like GNAT family acetyltransferase